MKKLLLSIIAILFSFNGWAEEVNFECCINSETMGKGKPCPGRPFHLSVNTETDKGSVRVRHGDGSWHTHKADVTFTKDQAKWNYRNTLGSIRSKVINRETLGVDWPDGPGDWGLCEIVKDNPKKQF